MLADVFVVIGYLGLVAGVCVLFGAGWALILASALLIGAGARLSRVSK